MKKITFIVEEKPIVVEIDDDLSVMEIAKNAGVPGIDADCGGQMVCGTCHVHVMGGKLSQLTSPDDMEEMILENVSEPHPTARLSCQLRVLELPDEITLEIPGNQR